MVKEITIIVEDGRVSEVYAEKDTELVVNIIDLDTQDSDEREELEKEYKEVGKSMKLVY